MDTRLKPWICLVLVYFSSQFSYVIGIKMDSGKVSQLPTDAPKLMKIFDNPNPNDGYESLRTFSSGLTDGIFKKQLYNTSIALTSALFSFELPKTGSTEASTVSMANQVIFGMFAMLAAVLIFSLPVLLTGTRFNPNARSNDVGEGVLDKIMESEPFATLIQNGAHKKIGLEPEKCLQKTICEAHRYPQNKRYGMLAVPFQIFYPPLSEGSDQSRATSFQQAAQIGKYKKTKCDKKYNCFFDVLDLGRYLLDWYQYHDGGLAQ